MYQRVDYSKTFKKQYEKLSNAQKANFKARLILFEQNPYAPVLRNHALKGKYSGYRSIDIEWDLRALYTVEAGVVAIFAFIGSRSQLY